jgi:hypothetical protein
MQIHQKAPGDLASPGPERPTRRGSYRALELLLVDPIEPGLAADGLYQIRHRVNGSESRSGFPPPSASRTGGVRLLADCIPPCLL